MDVIKYKGYEGTAEIDMDRFSCRGKILFIQDLITYQADNPADLKLAFEEAVDDYIETCVELGREPQKPFKGLFNVRISPELHQAATLKAYQEGSNLNSLVGKAIDMYVNGKSASMQNVNFNLNIPDQDIFTQSATSSSQTETRILGVTANAQQPH